MNILADPRYVPRFYRDKMRAKGLVSFEVVVDETDLHISASQMLEAEAEEAVLKYRGDIKDFINSDPTFKASFVPHDVPSSAPPIVKCMAEAGNRAGVGPMAAVAGAIAEFVGKDLLKSSSEVIVENGGDIFIKTLESRKMRIYAGTSSLSDKVSINIDPGQTPLGVCTSSGTVGHSVSFGHADAVVALSRNSCLADAMATAVGNLVKTEGDIKEALGFAEKIEGVEGVAIIIGDKMGMWGQIEISG